MLRLWFASLLCLTYSAASGQDYFQQDVSYDIDVRLDDRTHELFGELTLTYTNRSPDILEEIPFHIWPNAYSSTTSAFARQQLRNGNTRFHFAASEDRGALDGLNFTVDGEPAAHREDGVHPDIVHLPLPNPLRPEGTITIRTPFRVAIPASFSRLGHVGESYQITQWYPKPAVYDRDGWHALPYLDQGEFYGEFGSFRVSITLPENYVVGATGTLREGAERTWLLDKAARDSETLAAMPDKVRLPAPEFPPSAETSKTLTYTADRVHDFAWFADKRFYVQHDTLRLAGRDAPVEVWSLFTDTDVARWKRSVAYLKRSTRFYSEEIGTYPYPQVTGVQSALSAGGGMEYPMITVIGRTSSAAALDEVLAHEVGHNWFYGILGSNERASPWMDEGINSYYEQRYMARYYGKGTYNVPVVGNIDLDRLGYRYFARQGRDQSPNTDSDSLSEFNYWIQAYSKPALALHDLETYVGRARLDAAMQLYYDTWQFRHPRPDDFFQVLRSSLGPTISPWFEEAMLTTKTSDWQLGGLAAGRLSVAHTGSRLAPASAQLTTSDGDSLSRPLEPGENAEGRIDVGPATAARLPYAANRLDLYVHNNRSGARQPALKFGLSQENDEQYAIHAFPAAGYNMHDGVQLGFALHNRTLAPRRLEWAVAPLYGFKSGKVNGFAGARYRIVRPFSGVRQVMLHGGAQRWSDFTLLVNEEKFGYLRAAGKAEFQFDHPPITERTSSLFAQAIVVRRDRPAFSSTGEFTDSRTEGNYFLRLGYQSRADRTINPFGYELVLEYKNRDPERPTAFEAAHLRLDASVDGGYQYQRGRFFHWRAYAGYFLVNDLRESSFNPTSALSLLGNADSDYRYDGLYFGRNLNPEQPTWPDQQLERRQGGFRIPINNTLADYRSNSYLLAMNLDVDLPLGDLPVPLGVFLDAGVYGAKDFSADPITTAFTWVGGASLTTGDDRIGLFVPLFADPTTRDALERRGKIWTRLSVRLQLDGWLPWKWVDDLL